MLTDMLRGDYDQFRSVLEVWCFDWTKFIEPCKGFSR